MPRAPCRESNVKRQASERGAGPTLRGSDCQLPEGGDSKPGSNRASWNQKAEALT